ncbi:hypothetical protein MKW94_026291 [Papaver nudicaule]|uniref:Uncharacterized protein n=1 Tax=Papaver nudicaule TaxID=74823 RepID=A0AA41VQ55_PAPNU|nr:hypothetical protein [Papaver nudicaule]
MHSVLRLIITLDGEDVIDCEPILAENRTIIQYLPYFIFLNSTGGDSHLRWDYLSTMFTEAITVNGPEQLGNIQVPKRASYIRRERVDLFEAATGMR